MEPRFEKIDSFSLVGCPQYANPGKLCPGLAWGRLSAIKKKFNLSSDSEVEYAVEVYPPDFPQNDSTFYYMEGKVLRGRLFCAALSGAVCSDAKRLIAEEYSSVNHQDVSRD